MIVLRLICFGARFEYLILGTIPVFFNHPLGVRLLVIQLNDVIVVDHELCAFNLIILIHKRLELDFLILNVAAGNDPFLAYQFNLGVGTLASTCDPKFLDL